MLLFVVFRFIDNLILFNWL